MNENDFPQWMFATIVYVSIAEILGNKLHGEVGNTRFVWDIQLKWRIYTKEIYFFLRMSPSCRYTYCFDIIDSRRTQTTRIQHRFAIFSQNSRSTFGIFFRFPYNFLLFFFLLD